MFFSNLSYKGAIIDGEVTALGGGGMDGASFEKLVANDKRLQVYNDTVPAGILVLRVEDGAVLFANRSFNEIIGNGGATVFGETWGDFFVDAEDRQKLMVKFVEEDVVRNHELRLKRSDGKIIWGLASLADIPIENEDLLLFAFIDITALKEAEEEIRRLAHHDPLTGLPNLRLFNDHIERALARSRRKDYQTAVLFIDLDDFKGVNDTLGHEAGDEVLVDVSKRLLSCVREVDLVARIGGDEFLVMLENVESERVEEIGQRIVEALRLPIAVCKQEVVLGASIGVAFYPVNGNDSKSLIKAADNAMYRVKNDLKGAVALAT